MLEKYLIIELALWIMREWGQGHRQYIIEMASSINTLVKFRSTGKQINEE